MTKLRIVIDASHLLQSFYTAILVMIWIVLFLFLFLLGWPFLSPVEINLDTRIPVATIRWLGIGKVMVVYDKEEWCLKIQCLFFKSSRTFPEILNLKSKKKPHPGTRKNRGPKRLTLKKFFALLNTFEILKWEIAIDNTDLIINAWLYPLNFVPFSWQNLDINFTGKNYFALTIRTVPWRILRSWIK